MRGLLFAGFMAVSIVCASGCGRTGVIDTRRLACPSVDDQVLSVSTFNGNVTIRVMEGDSVRVVATVTSCLGATESGSIVTSLVPGRSCSLTADRPQSMSDAGVSFEVSVPPGVSIGSVETSNGRIEIYGAEGEAELSTSNGDVVVEGFRGTVRVDTSNGDVSLSGSGLNVGSTDTSNGDITAQSVHFEDGAELSTSNGDISVLLAQGFGAVFDMDTSNGDVTVTGPGFESVRTDGSEGSATMGTGGPTVRLISSNGGITLTSPGE